MGNLAARYGVEQGPQDPKLKRVAIEDVKDRPRAALAGVEAKVVVDDRVPVLEARVRALVGEVAAVRGLVARCEVRLAALEAEGGAVPVEVAALPEGEAVEVDQKPWVALGISRSSYFAKKKAGEL